MDNPFIDHQMNTLLKGDGLIQSSVNSLLRQQTSANLLQRGKQKIRAPQAGQHLSVYKGRGMDFA
jgi:hypothetical protein